MVPNLKNPFAKTGSLWRETALNEALTENASTTKRWQQYHNENKTAFENLERFSKHLCVEVMVPIGSKALVPGELIHTNEVLVSHFQGYFSKCSAHKAKEICQLRLQLADEQLKKLDREASIWQNKLDKPYSDGALATGEQVDLVEEITEDEHQQWMARHELMVQKWKVEQKLEREKPKNNDTIEKETLLAELGDDFKHLNITEITEEVLNNLLNSPNNTSSTSSDTQDAYSVTYQNDKNIFEMLEERGKVENKNQEMDNLKLDNSLNDIVLSLMGADDTESSKNMRTAHVQTEINEKKNVTSETPLERVPTLCAQSEETLAKSLSEVELIRKEAKFLPLEDQIVFYEYQIQIIQEKSKKLIKSVPNYNEEKLRLLNVIVSLTEDLEALLDQVDLNDSETEGSILEEELTVPIEKFDSNDVKSNSHNQKKKNRRISFALFEKTLEFRRNETVADMLPKPRESKHPINPDIISISKDSKVAEVTEDSINTWIKNADKLKKQNIIDKVVHNMNYVSDYQSIQNYDMVQTIIDAIEKRYKTLQIYFKHSPKKPKTELDSVAASEVDNISTPGDFYTNYLATKANSESNASNNATSFFVDGYEDQVKTPILNEAERNTAFEDPRSSFSTSDFVKTKDTAAAMPKRSILRNKSAVLSEIHTSDTNEKTKMNKKQSKKSRSSSVNITEEMSAYNIVMNKVTERVPNAPDPLPECKYIDANVPKKRLSRFKQQRIGKKNS